MVSQWGAVARLALSTHVGDLSPVGWIYLFSSDRSKNSDRGKEPRLRAQSRAQPQSRRWFGLGRLGESHNLGWNSCFGSSILRISEAMAARAAFRVSLPPAAG